MSTTVEKIKQTVGLSSSGGPSSAEPSGQRDDTKRNLGVLFTEINKIEIKDVGYPTFRSPVDKSVIEHGVILKVIITGVCGSDRHIIHGRTGENKTLVLGHEFTGEVIEKGSAVSVIQIGDIVSIPFNVACGHCYNCKKQNTNICLNVNAQLAGGAYGYAMSGGWHGGQAQYVMVPYADFNCLRFPAHYKDKIMAKILDLSLITDVLPTAYHGAHKAGVTLGKTVFIAGAGPVGLACAAICNLLGAAEVFIGDINPRRLELARAHTKCHVIDFSRHDNKRASELVKQVLGVPDVDCGVDCVGYEAYKTGNDKKEDSPAEVLNFLFNIVKAGGEISIPGVYMAPDPKGVDMNAKTGFYSLGFAVAWVKAINIVGLGQCPVMKYNWDLMMAILHDRLSVAKLLNIQVISLEETPAAFKRFDEGEPVKYVIDPHNMLPRELYYKHQSGTTTTTGTK